MHPLCPHSMFSSSFHQLSVREKMLIKTMATIIHQRKMKTTQICRLLIVQLNSIKNDLRLCRIIIEDENYDFYESTISKKKTTGSSSIHWDKQESITLENVPWNELGLTTSGVTFGLVVLSCKAVPRTWKGMKTQVSRSTASWRAQRNQIEMFRYQAYRHAKYLKIVTAPITALTLRRSGPWVWGLKANSVVGCWVGFHLDWHHLVAVTRFATAHPVARSTALIKHTCRLRLVPCTYDVSRAPIVAHMHTYVQQATCCKFLVAFMSETTTGVPIAW